jgi:hypothetical protein
MDSPVMAGFVAQLVGINKIADESPGFVWRLQDAAGDATNIHAFDDPMMLLNFSIWESVEALRDFVYRGGHVKPLRQRAEWFEKPQEAHMVLWWIPAGHIPSIAECIERLTLRRTHGDTREAFSFARPFPPPDASEEFEEAQCG